MNALDGLCRVRNGKFSRLSGSVLMLQEFLFCETDAVSVNALGVLGWHLGKTGGVGDGLKTSGRQTPSMNLNREFQPAFRKAFHTSTCGFRMREILGVWFNLPDDMEINNKSGFYGVALCSGITPFYNEIFTVFCHSLTHSHGICVCKKASDCLACMKLIMLCLP